MELWIAGRTLREIHLITDVPINNVKTRLYRAREKLKGCLEIDL